MCTMLETLQNIIKTHTCNFFSINSTEARKKQNTAPREIKQKERKKYNLNLDRDIKQCLKFCGVVF